MALLNISKPNPYLIALIGLVCAYFLINPLLKPGETEKLNNQLIFHGQVLDIINEFEEKVGFNERLIKNQTLLVEVSFPDGKKNVQVLNDYSPLKNGEKVLVYGNPKLEEPSYFVADINRKNGLIWLSVIFIAVVLLVSGMKGLYSLAGLLFSFAIIFFFIIPKIIAGYSPLIIGLSGSLLIVLVSLYCSHGLNRKSLSAFAGIGLALFVVSLLAKNAVGLLHLIGYGQEESIYLDQAIGNIVDLSDILIAGIVIAAIGILDDIAITQSSIVSSLKSIDGKMSKIQIFKKAMEIGHDHISAVINTLALAYAGAALPLLLLLSVQNFPVGFSINGQIVAEEIVRTIISTLGLMLAAPFTTAIAVFWVDKSQENHTH